MLIETALILTTAVVSSTSGITSGGGASIVQLLLVALTPTGLATFLTALYMRRKIKADTGHVDADAVQILTNTSVSLLEPMKQQIQFLTDQLKAANEQITFLTATVKDLKTELDEYRPGHDDDQ